MNLPASVIAGLNDALVAVSVFSLDMLWGTLPTVATGGSSWTLQRPSSGGVGGPATSEPAVTRTNIWVVRAQDIGLGETSAGTAVGEDDWLLYAPAATNLKVGDRLTSQTTPAFKVRIDTLQKTEDGRFWEGTVEQPR